MNMVINAVATGKLESDGSRVFKSRSLLSVSFWYVILRSLINRRSTISIGTGSTKENVIVIYYNTASAFSVV